MAQRTQFSTHYIPFVIVIQPSLSMCFEELIKYLFGEGKKKKAWQIPHKILNWKGVAEIRGDSNSIKSDSHNCCLSSSIRSQERCYLSLVESEIEIFHSSLLTIRVLFGEGQQHHTNGGSFSARDFPALRCCVCVGKSSRTRWI